MLNTVTNYYIYPPGSGVPKDDKIEYEKLWMEQSKLFWSRLQTAALIQTAVFAAWYQLEDNILRNGVLILGGILLILVALIMWRDGSVSNIYKERIGIKNHFPWGRLFGFMMIISLIFSNLVLLLFPFQSHTTQNQEVKEIRSEIDFLKQMLNRTSPPKPPIQE